MSFAKYRNQVCVWVLLLSIASIPYQLQAETTVYKSIDEQGNVTFSSESVENAVSEQAIQLPAGPSDDQVETAQQRVRDSQQRADTMENQRLKRDKIRQADENARQQLKLQQEQAGANTNEDNGFYGYPAYRKPGYGHRPGKPGHQPGHKPGHKPGNKPGHQPSQPIQHPGSGGGSRLHR